MTVDTAPQDEDLGRVVQTAETEATEADALVEALEDRVLAGDPEVTAAEFEQAQCLAKFARKRADGARARKAVAEAEVRRVALDGLAADIRAAAGVGGRCSPRALEDAKQAFEATVSAAATKLVAVAKSQEAAVAELHRRAAEIDVPRVEPGAREHEKPNGPHLLLSGLYAGPSEGDLPCWQLSQISEFLGSDALRKTLTDAVGPR